MQANEEILCFFKIEITKGYMRWKIMVASFIVDDTEMVRFQTSLRIMIVSDVRYYSVGFS